MDFIRALLEQQSLLALFLVVAIGYLVGEINLRGFSLGVGAVLFVALGVGWFAPRSAPPAILGNFGLALFLYTVGIQYAKQFFIGLTSSQGLKANFVGLSGVLAAGAVSLLLIKPANLNVGYALGLFAGAGTNTPTLQSAIEVLGNDDPAVGYSIAYPIGVAGPILILYLVFSFLKPKVEVPTSSGLELLEITLDDPQHIGARLGDLISALPRDVRVAALRRDRRNQPARVETVLMAKDTLLLVAPSKTLLEQARVALGSASPGAITQDRRDLDYLRVFVSRSAVAGQCLAKLELPGERAAIVVHVRRGDGELLARPDLELELGDRVGLFANRSDFSALRRFFGDSIRGTADFSYISIGLGIALGLLLGAIKVPLPGIGKVSLGLSGVLLVALILGRQGRLGGLNWNLPASANLVLRNLGLTVFLAQVGMASGPKFAATVAETGLEMLALGTIVLAAFVVPMLICGLYLFRLPFDEVAGIVAGVCCNPAILAYASRLAPNDKPDVGYAMIMPGMTIVKILFVSTAPSFI